MGAIEDAQIVLSIWRVPSLMARFGDTPFGHQLEATGSDKRLPASVGDNEGAIATSLMARFWRYARRIIFRCSCSNRPCPLREESCFIPAETAECSTVTDPSGRCKQSGAE